jgi:hypothetical protein
MLFGFTRGDLPCQFFSLRSAADSVVNNVKSQVDFKSITNYEQLANSWFSKSRIKVGARV